jgi:hypothetical protein
VLDRLSRGDEIVDHRSWTSPRVARMDANLLLRIVSGV